MGKLYIPLAGGAALADTLSRGVYKLSRPDGWRPADYVTTHAFAWVVHPQSGAVALELNEQQLIPVHVAADPSQLLALLASLKDNEDQPLTTPEQRAMLAALVQQNAGQRLPLAYLVPPKAMEGAMTPEQAQAAGWFDVPEPQL